MKAALIVSALLAATTVVSAGRLHTPTPSNSQQLVRRSFIVEYDDHYSHSHFATALKRRQIEVDVHKEYEIFNGAAITLRSEEHSGEHLATLAGIKNVWPVTTYSLPHIREPHNPIEPFAEGVIQAAAVSNHNSTGVNVLHDSFNLTGAGIKVGVLDSGVDYNHPVFAIPPATKGCFAVDSPTCRFIKGWDFVGDAYTSSKMPVPGPDPMDRHGHGTHVAGIIGGNALSPTIVPRPITPWVGVAPGVTFGIYKVIGKAGVTTTEVLLSAMEMAYKDGMNVSWPSSSFHLCPIFFLNITAVLPCCLLQPLYCTPLPLPLVTSFSHFYFPSHFLLPPPTIYFPICHPHVLFILLLLSLMHTAQQRRTLRKSKICDPPLHFVVMLSPVNKM